MKTPIQFLCAECKKAMTEYYKLVKRKQRKLKPKVVSQQQSGKVNIKIKHGKHNR